jgi:hypothetical protein
MAHGSAPAVKPTSATVIEHVLARLKAVGLDRMGHSSCLLARRSPDGTVV